MIISSLKSKIRLFLIALIVIILSNNISNVIIHNGSSPHRKGEPFAAIKYEQLRLCDPETGKIPNNIRWKELSFVNKKLHDSKLLKTKQESFNSFEWKRRGPFTIGGRTRGLAIDIKNESILIAGSVSGGIWKSTNGGENWYKVSKPNQIHSITNVVQDTRRGHEKTWYCCTGELIGGADQARDFVPYRGDGIFKSIDNGETWQLLESTSSRTIASTDSPFDWCWKVIVNNSNLLEDELYAATYHGIYRSINGGSTWQKVLGGIEPAWLADIEVSSDGNMYAALSFGDKRGIWKSRNGISWEKIIPSFLPSHYERILIAIPPSNNNITYFLIDTTDVFNFDWTSDPNGPKTGQMFLVYNLSEHSWENRSDFLPTDYQSNISYCMSLDVHPANENLIFLGGRMLYRSNDGFKSKSNTKQIGGHFWMYLGTHVDYHKIVFSNINPNVLYTATDGGISKTSNGLSDNPNWIYLNNGYTTSQFYTSAIVPNVADDKIILSGANDHGVFYTNSETSTDSWNYLNYADGAFTALLKNGSFLLFNNHDAGSTYLTDRVPRGMYKDALRGITYIINNYTFTKVNPSISNPLFINPFIVDYKNEGVVYMAGGKQLYVCEDIFAIPLNNSQNTKNLYWKTISNINNGQITAIEVSDVEPNILYFGTSLGKLYQVKNPLSTPKVKAIINASFPNTAYLSNIKIDPNDNDHIILCFSNYGVKSIFASWDGGDTWSHVTGNLEEKPDGKGDGPAVNWVDILPTQDGNKYFAATTVGIFSTYDLQNNTIWQQEGIETIGNINVKHLVSRQIDGEVVVSTYGNGIYSRKYNITSSKNKQDLIPKFSLSQNYPNPFNPVTKIKYRINNETLVTLKVYNSIGKEVSTLVDEIKTAGIYDIDFDGSGISSGVYYCHLLVDEQSITKKMILLK